MVLETPLIFGPDQNLVGVLTRPGPGECPSLAFLLFNAGVVSRIGMHRINVKIARALADRGHLALRFDVAGLGDSRVAAHSSDGPSQAARDIQHAMDEVERSLGITQFVLIGMCSGAVASFEAATADRRVAALMMFDGIWHHSRYSKLMQFWKRLRALPAREYGAKAGQRLKALISASAANKAAASPYEIDGNPRREAFAKALQAIADRGTSVCIVYSGSVLEAYSYESQFRHAFSGERFIRQVRCDYRPDIDHTFMTIDAQKRMLELIFDWAATFTKLA